VKYSWKWISAVCALIIGIAATVAVAAPSGGGSGSGSDQGTQDRGELRLRAPGPDGPGHRRHLSALAKELGVSTSKLREALEAVRDDARPPQPPARKSRAEMERRCKELTDALAKELGKDGDEVRAAIKKVAKAGVERAVDANRLTRAQADRILQRIDAADCLPPVPHGGHGCGGPGRGGHHRGGPGRFGPPPADGDGGRSDGSFMPAPVPSEAVPAI
jgi:hypothetical protein